MKIIIETTGSEQIAIRPEDPQQTKAGSSSSISAAAIDGGSPRAELLQALSEGAMPQRMQGGGMANVENNQGMTMPGDKSSLWH